jgi:AcrR family transcriptional regulator
MGIKERKLRDLENRKQLILKTAKELFYQKGFNTVTLDDIATKIEFSKGTIYSHFESKEEIYAHLLLEHLSILLGFLKESVRNSRNTIDGIQKCLNVYIDFYRKHKEYFQLLFFIDIFSNHYKIPQVILKKIQSLKIACLSELQLVLKRGATSREITNNFSLKYISLVLWGMTNGILHLVESKQIKTSDLDQLIDVGFEIVTKGLKEKTEKIKE